MASHYEAPIRKPLVIGNKGYHDVTVDIAAPVEGRANKHWWIVFSIALVAFLWGIGCIIYTVSTGIGTWGLNKTVNWAWDITNFVWWVGIGHAGTLISAVLLLFRQKWRMAINGIGRSKSAGCHGNIRQLHPARSITVPRGRPAPPLRG